MPNIPENLEPPRSATAPNRTLALRTSQVEGQYVRDVEILAIGWNPDPAAPPARTIAAADMPMPMQIVRTSGLTNCIVS